MSITREHVRLPDDSEIPDYYLIAQPSYAVAAAISTDNRFIMLRKYKHGAGRIVLACPGGNMDVGVDARVAAERELLEETGYGSGEWTALGRFACHGSQGCGETHFFLAKGVKPLRPPAANDPDRDAIELLAHGAIRKALDAGEIAVLGHAAALALAFAALK